ncbi:MAG: sensor histidine kinase [Lachnospiraceae bacterium]
MKVRLYYVFTILSLACVLLIGVRAATDPRADLILIISVIALGVCMMLSLFERNNREDFIRRQETELKMYRMYVQPLEELVKDIRARQHEFDNHLNAILNMHLTIDTYDELVKEQTEYGGMLYAEDRRKFFPLLRISDKVLAGFLYSKIMNAAGAEIEVQVLNYVLISRAAENDIIEVIGTLLDNAVEACSGEQKRVHLSLDSKEDRLIFKISNQVEKMTLGQAERFFEKGYSTKQNDGKRGLGLYNAKKIVNRVGGTIEVSVEEREEGCFVCFCVNM